MGMFSRWMYCQISNSVQLEMGKTRRLRPGEPCIVELPKFWALVLGIPAVRWRAHRNYPLLGAAFLLVTAGAPESSVKAVLVQRLLSQSLRLPEIGIARSRDQRG